MRIFRVLVAFSLVVAGVVSTGCDGGGGGGNDGIFAGMLGPPPTPDVDISIANAQDVSAAVVRATDQVFDVVTTVGGQVFPSPPAAPDLLSSNSKFELFARLGATGGSVTDTCAVSGTVTVSASFNNVSLSRGDEFDLVFHDCDDGDGYTLDGSFSLLVIELDGDPRTDVFRISYELQDMTLTVASGMETYTASIYNSLVLDWDSVAFPEIVLTTQLGRPFVELQLSSQADVYSLFGRQSLMVNADISVSTTLREASGWDLSSAFLGGDIYSHETIVPLLAPDGQDPESGEILISEYDKTGSIRIVIESSDIVRLDMDLDGDGIVDDTQYTTWASLRG